MKRTNLRSLGWAIGLLGVFFVWTMAIQWVDVQAIGPLGSIVGFAAINRFVHDLTGVHMSLYVITDWLSLVPLMMVFGFGMLGLVQWVRRKHLLKVDYSILVLGGFYIVVLAAYLFFEGYVVNYRPVLIDGALEASYPSSTTMLVMCVMPTAAMQFNARIQNKALKRCVATAIAVFVAFMVICRFVSGVHWFTDIAGGALLSAGLVLIYRVISRLGNG